MQLRIWAIFEASYSENRGSFHYARYLFTSEAIATEALELMKSEFNPQIWEEREFYVGPVDVYSSVKEFEKEI